MVKIDRIPVVNLFYSITTAKHTPSLSAVKDSLQSMGLLTALLLTVMMALPMSVGYSELKQAEERWNTPLYQEYGYSNGKEVIKAFITYTIVATATLGTAVISTVFLLAFMETTKSHGTNDTELISPAWWSWARWGFLWDLLNTIVGVSVSFFAFNRLLFVKFPDYDLEDNNTAPFLHIGSTYGFSRGVAVIWLAVPIAVLAVVIGFAHRAAYDEQQAIAEP